MHFEAIGLMQKTLYFTIVYAKCSREERNELWDGAREIDTRGQPWWVLEETSILLYMQMKEEAVTLVLNQWKNLAHGSWTVDFMMEATEENFIHGQMGSYDKG